MNDNGVDRDLFRDWAAARSLSRGLAAPVADHGGWRVETDSAGEIRRYFFDRPDAEITTLADSITTPRIFLKLCEPVAVLQQLAGPRWQVEATGYWMVRAVDGCPAAAVPDGFTLSRERVGDVVNVTVHEDASGVLAASGHAASAGGVYAYDRIVTGPDFRRRGLARAVMAALDVACPSRDLTHALVASHAGRPLYESLGWRAIAPYSTAVLFS